MFLFILDHEQMTGRMWPPLQIDTLNQIFMAGKLYPSIQSCIIRTRRIFTQIFIFLSNTEKLDSASNTQEITSMYVWETLLMAIEGM
jgi:hypothetical protein